MLDINPRRRLGPGRTLASAAVFVIALAAVHGAQAQQRADEASDVTVASPRWAPGLGPHVAVDRAHGNFHTIEGRYSPFARLLANDGYVVTSFDSEVTAEALADVDVLVIANARGGRIGNLRALSTPAFAAGEIDALRQWVLAGGSLFLIADHAPFPSAVTSLAASFGVHWDNGYADGPGDDDVDIFSIEDGTVSAGEVLQRQGRPVRQVRSFTGSSFLAPPAAEILLPLGEGWRVYVADENDQISPDGPSFSAARRAQLAALQVGEGRVVVAAEAAMFTSQRFDDEAVPEGFASAGATDNRMAVLNLLEWLSR